MSGLQKKKRKKHSYGALSPETGLYFFFIVYIKRQVLRRRKTYKIRNIAENITVL